MKPVQVAFIPQPGGEWRVLTVHGAPANAPRCILVAPGADVLAREVDAAGATPAQSRAAALAALAPQLASAPDRNACAVGAMRGGRQLAFLVLRERIYAWIDTARKAGLDAEAIVPDFALLPRPAAGVAHLAGRDDAVVRTHTGGFTCQRELLTALAGDLKLVEVDLEQSAIDTVRSGALNQAPDLLSAIRVKAPRSSARGQTWSISAAAAAALVVAAVTPWITTMRANGETSRLRTEAVAVARTALPDARQIVDPLAQLREAAMPQRRSETSLTHAAGLLEGLARAPSVRLSRLELGEDGAVRASLSAAYLSQLQPLRDYITSLGLGHTETPGTSSPNHLTIDLVVTGAP